ncbi:FKBP-type peptidyl-prolyl cis-trans isomerase SlyD [Microbacter margulisiae]|uniref:peptidylprolyl isomerase n=2 Tax=Microbacter margulisiae TaxID=1350067 RepID=A0A7W5DR86_9PORP|nr:FKBP-type peptidyl-prolyl cis-trans isomerase SlyD [Microbacter margulisiae]
MVSVTYDLFVGGNDEEPELMEQATAQNPLTFCFGIGMMLPEFENNLRGLKQSDTFQFSIDSKNAYGEYDDENVVALPRSIFEVNGELDSDTIFEGNVVPLMDSDGNRLNAQIVEIADSTITVDFNHPLAGETLHFKGSVLEVREATDEDLAAFQGGCSCGSDGCSCGVDEEDGCGCGSGGCGCHS